MRCGLRSLMKGCKVSCSGVPLVLEDSKCGAWFQGLDLGYRYRFEVMGYCAAAMWCFRSCQLGCFYLLFLFVGQAIGKFSTGRVPRSVHCWQAIGRLHTTRKMVLTPWFIAVNTIAYWGLPWRCNYCLLRNNTAFAAVSTACQHSRS